ncbi:unnamed protein product [Amoebophrya sp. A120]|nr:unnamed protein product [Amoebophrya sp. A120]|eukprot:GSA120T00019246001.1
MATTAAAAKKSAAAAAAATTIAAATVRNNLNPDVAGMPSSTESSSSSSEESDSSPKDESWMLRPSTAPSTTARERARVNRQEGFTTAVDAAAGRAGRDGELEQDRSEIQVDGAPDPRFSAMAGDAEEVADRTAPGETSTKRHLVADGASPLDAKRPAPISIPSKRGSRRDFDGSRSRSTTSRSGGSGSNMPESASGATLSTLSGDSDSGEQQAAVKKADSRDSPALQATTRSSTSRSTRVSSPTRLPIAARSSSKTSSEQSEKRRAAPRHSGEQGGIGPVLAQEGPPISGAAAAQDEPPQQPSGVEQSAAAASASPQALRSGGLIDDADYNESTAAERQHQSGSRASNLSGGAAANTGQQAPIGTSSSTMGTRAGTTTATKLATASSVNRRPASSRSAKSSSSRTRAARRKNKHSKHYVTTNNLAYGHKSARYYTGEQAVELHFRSNPDVRMFCRSFIRYMEALLELIVMMKSHVEFWISYYKIAYLCLLSWWIFRMLVVYYFHGVKEEDDDDDADAEKETLRSEWKDEKILEVKQFLKAWVQNQIAKNQRQREKENAEGAPKTEESSKSKRSTTAGAPAAQRKPLDEKHQSPPTSSGRCLSSSLNSKSRPRLASVLYQYASTSLENLLEKAMEKKYLRRGSRFGNFVKAFAGKLGKMGRRTSALLVSENKNEGEILDHTDSSFDPRFGVNAFGNNSSDKKEKRQRSWQKTRKGDEVLGNSEVELATMHSSKHDLPRDSTTSPSGQPVRQTFAFDYAMRGKSDEREQEEKYLNRIKNHIEQDASCFAPQDRNLCTRPDVVKDARKSHEQQAPAVPGSLQMNTLFPISCFQAGPAIVSPPPPTHKQKHMEDSGYKLQQSKLLSKLPLEKGKKKKNASRGLAAAPTSRRADDRARNVCFSSTGVCAFANVVDVVNVAKDTVRARENKEGVKAPPLTLPIKRLRSDPAVVKQHAEWHRSRRKKRGRQERGRNHTEEGPRSRMKMNMNNRTSRDRQARNNEESRDHAGTDATKVPGAPEQGRAAGPLVLPPVPAASPLAPGVFVPRPRTNENAAQAPGPSVPLLRETSHPRTGVETHDPSDNLLGAENAISWLRPSAEQRLKAAKKMFDEAE